MNRQVIHSRRNRSLQNPRVQFSISHSPTMTPINVSSSTIQSTPQTPLQQNTSNSTSDCLGSTPTYEQIRENSFNPPNHYRTSPILDDTSFHSRRTKFNKWSNRRFIWPIFVTTWNSFTSLDTFLNSISQTPIPPNFPKNLDARYRENSTNNIQLRLDFEYIRSTPSIIWK